MMEVKDVIKLGGWSRKMESNDLDIEKIRAEITHLNAQSAKLMAETRWYPALVVGGIFAAALALLKLVLT